MSQTPSDTFKLSYPFTTAAGTRIELVELKRLTVKDLKQVRKISKNPADWDMIVLLCKFRAVCREKRVTDIKGD